VVARVFSTTGIPVAKELAGLCCTNGKHPDGMTLIPWKAGKPVVCNATSTCTMALSYINSTDDTNTAAEIAAIHKTAK